VEIAGNSGVWGWYNTECLGLIIHILGCFLGYNRLSLYGLLYLRGFWGKFAGFLCFGVFYVEFWRFLVFSGCFADFWGLSSCLGLV